MSEDVRDYIDSKFDRIISNIKWGIAILVIVLGTYGGMIIANMQKVNQHEFDLMLLDTTAEDLKYKSGWLTELNELQRDFIKAYVNNEDVTEFFEELNRMEKRIMAGGDPMPSLRSYKRTYSK